MIEQHRRDYDFILTGLNNTSSAMSAEELMMTWWRIGDCIRMFEYGDNDGVMEKQQNRRKNASNRVFIKHVYINALSTEY